jgi:hypothetical protein
MRGKSQSRLNFIVDRLTDSIVNSVLGESFRTEILPFTHLDARRITKKAGWKFNWKSELASDGRKVYKLVIKENPGILHGLLSIEIKADHISMHLLENAPFNIGKGKLYEGVAGNMVAYACHVSFQSGFEGVVAFTAKTRLIRHYEQSLDAVWIGGQNMIINTLAARILVEKYFNR